MTRACPHASKIIQIREFFVERIVFFGPDEDDIGGQTGCTADFIGELVGFCCPSRFFCCPSLPEQGAGARFPGRRIRLR